MLQIGVTYDWRLAVPNMEKRDGYFTRLKMVIEWARNVKDEKVRNCPILHQLSVDRLAVLIKICVEQLLSRPLSRFSN